MSGEDASYGIVARCVTAALFTTVGSYGYTAPVEVSPSHINSRKRHDEPYPCCRRSSQRPSNCNTVGLCHRYRGRGANHYSVGIVVPGKGPPGGNSSS